MGEELENLTLQCNIRGEETLKVEYLPAVISKCCSAEIAEGIAHLWVIPLITWVAKKWEENLPPYHVVGNWRASPLWARRQSGTRWRGVLPRRRPLPRPPA